MSDTEQTPLLLGTAQNNVQNSKQRRSKWSNWCFRYTALVFICLFGFGTEFCYILPAALEDKFEHDLAITTDQYSLFYSLYSWPSALLCLLGGFLIDRVLGIRAGAILFTSLVTVGQYLFAYGALVNNLWLMYAGRFVVGMGGEAIFVAQKAYAVRWFDANELNMVFGCMASVALLGSSVNQLVMDPLYNAVSARSTSSAAACLGITILLASLADVMSALCACVLYPMDKRRVEQATIELSNNEGI